LNIAGSLKEGLPYQQWAAELVKKRKADNAKDDPNIHCLLRGLSESFGNPQRAELHLSPDIRRWA
jgi:hypothetical protein